MIKYFTSKDLSKMFNVSSLTIKREYQRGKLHGFTVGNELRFSQQDVDDYTCLLEHQKSTREIELENEIEELKKKLNYYEQVFMQIDILTSKVRYENIKEKQNPLNYMNG